MKRSVRLLRLLVCCFIFRTVCAQSDDITLMKTVSPVFFLNNAFSETLLTSAGEEAEIRVSSIAVEADRILVRFYITGLSESWRSAINDETRLYGSYLPTAEIVLEDGTFLTPSSSSRYSFLEYNARLIIGGLLVFDTAAAPQAFYLNFNQIPFDTQPLSRGFTKAVILSSAEQQNNPRQDQQDPLSDTVSDAEFTVIATAQTNELTMVQPAVRMLRADETLTKFGWIAFSDMQSGKRYAVTRGNLYGFNLTDDERYSPAHAYVFSALTADGPIRISMDHIYVQRTLSGSERTVLSLRKGSGEILSESDGTFLRVTEIRSVPEEERIRLYIDSGELNLSDIAFSFYDLPGTVRPQTACGIDMSEGRFACDIFFSENAFPTENIILSADKLEYRKDGPWELTWTPVRMEVKETVSAPVTYYPNDRDTYPDGQTASVPDEVSAVLDAVSSLNDSLIRPGKWIRETYRISYDLSEQQRQKLIPVDQAGQYYTDYVSDKWSYVSSDGYIHEDYSVIRDPETDRILSVTYRKDDIILDPVHGLKAKSEYPLNYRYSCFEAFAEIVRSSAVFTEEKACEFSGSPMTCLYFYQSLNGIPDSPGSQSIVFILSPEDGFIRGEIIDYDLGELILTRTTLALETADKLPDDLIAITESLE